MNANEENDTRILGRTEGNTVLLKHYEVDFVVLEKDGRTVLLALYAPSGGYRAQAHFHERLRSALCSQRKDKIIMHQKHFSTEQGRRDLYTIWFNQRVADNLLNAHSQYTLPERCTFLADWLRWCITEGHLDPHARLPPYKHLTALPLDIEKQDVARVICQLRTEHLLPARKTRKDANRSQWTPRDLFCLNYIGHMHALRFDQLQRLLARTSPSQQAQTILSLSRTWEIVNRWIQAKFTIYQQVYEKQPGWVFLTRKGLHFIGLTFRAEAPSIRLLEHLYWINEIRMKLEQEHPDMQWISERSIQAGKGMREAGQGREHIPDGILVLIGDDGERVPINIEVQISKPIPKEVKKVMAGEDRWTWNSAPLRYYVNRKSQGVVRAIYRKMMNDLCDMRSSIEIIDLDA